ncbi:major facilitator superfamily domain-containing protein [Boletus edulis BED1]|uniref:Major facilitator superfamily domain-containing protein n=1 Tax=Boletus edulis BED1 TaxID=1328754 RepID=A0AAD4BIQ0_BOLED|nr:major facilitator superfamily domain-containing protein [Boletus edulis BED1]
MDRIDESRHMSQQPAIFDRPTGWRKLYYHPILQVALLGFVCFMCPGMFNAINGLGGGGLLTTTVSANANSAVYATFAFFGFFSGTINNRLGPRLTLTLGTWGYSLYIASYLVVNIHPDAGAFVIAAGAILGVCASLLWTAQGSLMMSYPTEAQKGVFIGIFWAIFNLGGVVGSSVAFGQNFNSTVLGNGTYITFIILSLIGVVLTFFMADPNKMIRTDGTKVVRPSYPSWKAEFVNLFVALKKDAWIVLLFPMFVASNYFTTWQFNDYNGAIFTIRARGLNNLVYWVAQIIGSVFIGYVILDQKLYRRRVRAFIGWVLVFAMVFVVHIWAYFYQRTYTRQSVSPATNIDIYSSNYPAHVWLMIFCGFLDSMWQTYAYWLMGAMSNNLSTLAVFTGFYKSLQSAGAAGVWRADGVGLPYINIFLSTWALTAAGMVFAFPMVYYRVRDHTEDERVNWYLWLAMGNRWMIGVTF